MFYGPWQSNLAHAEIMDATVYIVRAVKTRQDIIQTQQYLTWIITCARGATCEKLRRQLESKLTIGN